MKEGRVGTAESYSWALNSFKKIVGDVEGFKVDKNVIERWNDGMKNGILVDGNIIGKIADATRGMDLRTCRVVWNECIKRPDRARQLISHYVSIIGNFTKHIKVNRLSMSIL